MDGWLGSSLLDLSLKVSLILLAAVVLTGILRRSGAAGRTALWSLALVGVLAVPLVAPWLPSWQLGLELPTFAATPPAAGALSTLSPPVTSPLRAELPVRPASSQAQHAAPVRPMATLAGEVPEAGGVASAVRLELLWLAGFLAGLGYLAVGWWRIAGITRRALLAEEEWQGLLERCRRQTGVGRPVVLRFSDEIRSPVVWGLRRPRVLLPASAAAWSEERRRVVLLHELIHVRRSDWLLRVLARVACAVYWYNPLVWVAARRLVLEQEKACDDRVLRLGTRPSSYAQHLLELARDAARPSLAPALALELARRSQMEGRLMSILDPEKASVRPRAFVLPAVLLAALILTVAAMQPWTADAAPQGASLQEVVTELDQLESRLEPFHEQLAALELELEPVQEQMEAMESELEPHQEQLEAMESELEPHHGLIDAVDTEMEAYAEQMEAIEAELEPYHAQLEAVERELEPVHEQMESLHAEMEPVHEQMEAIHEEMEPLHKQLQELQEKASARHGEAGEQTQAARAQLEELHARMQGHQRRMEELHERLRPYHLRMEELHLRMKPVHERMEEIHKRMEPVHQRMEAVHKQMEPFHHRMEELHKQMEPVHERMEQVHRQMEPVHQRMEEVHRRMEPVHRRMEEVHKQMEPVHREMERLHEQLHNELRTELRSRLEGVTGSTAGLDAATDRILDQVSIRIRNGRLGLLSSPPALRELLAEELGLSGERLEEAVRAVTELEVRSTLS